MRPGPKPFSDHVKLEARIRELEVALNRERKRREAVAAEPAIVNNGAAEARSVQATDQARARSAV